ncbi:MAG: stress response translation initiation inhibitor YciH [Nanoarchaeota archaeon]
MNNICPKCGLKLELCVCESLAKETQIVTVRTVKRRFGKVITLVGGIDNKAVNLKELAKKLKEKLACGGTVKDHIIELQGSHVQQAKQELIRLGFDSVSIRTA